MNKITKEKAFGSIVNIENENLIIFNGEYQMYSKTKDEIFKSDMTIEEVKTHIKSKDIDAVVYDKTENKIIIYKSYFSKEPVYYSFDGNLFIWSNSLINVKKTIGKKTEINNRAIALYFALTYIPPPYTIYKNIFKLPNNHTLIIDCNTFEITIEETTGYRTKLEKSIGIEQAKNITYNKVMQAVEQMRQKEWGSFLSGGVDSAIISYCLSKQLKVPIKTFSLGFENKRYDESEAAKVVSDLIKSEHYSIVLNKGETLLKLDEILSSFEEPYADSSLIPSYIIADEAKKHVPGVLTGDGGDEVFGGYNKYHIGKLNNIYTSIIPSSLHSFFINKGALLLKNKEDKRGLAFKINKSLSSFSYNNDFFYNIISLGFKPNELQLLFRENYDIGYDIFQYYKEQCPEPTGIHDFRKVDYMISMQGDMIPKVYNSTNAIGLDYHSPFMSKNLWFYANSLPEKFLIKGSNKKYILKEAFKDHFPKNYFNLPKKGFGIPVGDWLRNELKSELMSYINYDFIESQNIFNYPFIFDIINDHKSGKTDNTFKVWAFYCFQKWYKKNCE